jgi:hypothetical protein
MDETDTYFPPSWLNTLAYSLSAPTALMTLVVGLADATRDEVTASSAAGPTSAPARTARPRSRAQGRRSEEVVLSVMKQG